MKGTPAEGTVRAKTGTLAHVVTLAGYATTRSGRVLAFALFFDDLPENRRNTARRLQDRLAIALASLE
jgi:D-alanyl-D-alanine carboxypeptidase/D-alanyl-D-alanine-endopeptidase (penicillin-binding protein 4)